tara:strand:+ start:130 stop:324 length:195 start_codon:yes stop_codon:yes gene_type:complete
LLLFAKKKGNRREQREQSTFVITGYNNETHRCKGTVISRQRGREAQRDKGTVIKGKKYLLVVDN